MTTRRKLTEYRIDTMSNSLITLANLSELERDLGDDTPTEELARQLVHSAKYFLENAKQIEGAKEIHDTLRRLQIQFEQRHATLFASNTIAAQRIRSEWHIGRTLSEMPRGHGGRGSDSLNGKSFLVAIEAAGIDKSSAYRWQKIGELDPQDVELYFEDVQKKCDEITTRGILHWFTSHVVVDADDDNGGDADPPDAPEMSDDLPQTRMVEITCRHCGVKDEYEIGA